MSRLAAGFEGVLIPVVADTEGVPVHVSETPVLEVSSHHRLWVGVLSGEPQRDVWHVKTERGLFELHRLTFLGADELGESSYTSSEDEWRLMRWED